MGPFTYDDYAAHPDDGHRYELIDGDLLEKPTPWTAHQRVLGNILCTIARHIDSHALGEVLPAPLDVILDARNAPQPDILFVANTRRRLISERGIEGPPTLVVEVLSPGPHDMELVTKRRLYREHGIPHYWVVDPDERTLEGLLWAADDYRTEAKFAGDERAVLSPFPDLIIPLGEVWTPETH